MLVKRYNEIEDFFLGAWEFWESRGRKRLLDCVFVPVRNLYYSSLDKERGFRGGDVLFNRFEMTGRAR